MNLEKNMTYFIYAHIRLSNLPKCVRLSLGEKEAKFNLTHFGSYKAWLESM